MTEQIVGIVDYGAGNIRSIISAFEHLGVDAERVKNAWEFEDLTHLVLPGVGAYGYCLEKLQNSGLLPLVEDWAIKEQRPLLGICVGMQLLANSSEEYSASDGLGWIGGNITRLKSVCSGVRVPHVGWNEVQFLGEFGDYSAQESGDFYFDHSFAYDEVDRTKILAVCNHGREFAAIVRKGNIVASQFHPEKSQKTGMRLLQGFLEMGG